MTKPVNNTGTVNVRKPESKPVLKPVTAYERLREQAESIVRSNGYRKGTVFELGNTLFAVTDNGVEGVRVGGKYPVGGYQFDLIKQRNGQFNFVQENFSWSVGKQSPQPRNFGGYLATGTNNNTGSASSGQNENIVNGVLNRLVQTLGFKDTKEAQQLIPIIRQNIGRDIATTYNNTLNYLNRQYDKAKSRNESDVAILGSLGAWVIKNIGNLFKNPLPQLNKGGVVNAALTPNEIVVPANRAKEIGYDKLEFLNNLDKGNIFSGGGQVQGNNSYLGDIIPAVLGTGDYVINADSAKLLPHRIKRFFVGGLFGEKWAKGLHDDSLFGVKGLSPLIGGAFTVGTQIWDMFSPKPPSPYKALKMSWDRIKAFTQLNEQEKQEGSYLENGYLQTRNDGGIITQGGAIDNYPLAHEISSTIDREKTTTNKNGSSWLDYLPTIGMAGLGLLLGNRKEKSLDEEKYRIKTLTAFGNDPYLTNKRLSEWTEKRAETLAIEKGLLSAKSVKEWHKINKRNKGGVISDLPNHHIFLDNINKGKIFKGNGFLSGWGNEILGDVIPAQLNHGDYVINAKASKIIKQNNPDLFSNLTKLNSGGLKVDKPIDINPYSLMGNTKKFYKSIISPRHFNINPDNGIMKNSNVIMGLINKSNEEWNSGIIKNNNVVSESINDKLNNQKWISGITNNFTILADKFKDNQKWDKGSGIINNEKNKPIFYNNPSHGIMTSTYQNLMKFKQEKDAIEWHTGNLDNSNVINGFKEKNNKEWMSGITGNIPSSQLPINTIDYSHFKDKFDKELPTLKIDIPQELGMDNINEITEPYQPSTLDKIESVPSKVSESVQSIPELYARAFTEANDIAQNIDVNYNVQRINGIDYVSKEEFMAGIQYATQAGANIVQNKLKYNPNYRRNLGI